MSGDRRLDELWARASLGEALDEAERREFGEALAAEVGLRDRLARDQWVDGVLRTLGREVERDEAFARRVSARLEAEEARERSAASAERRLGGRRRLRWPLAVAGLGLAGAGALAAVAILGRPPAAPPPGAGHASEAAPPPAPGAPPPAPAVRLASVAGRVYRVVAGRRIAAREQEVVMAGDGLVTDGVGSGAALVFADGTRVEVAPDGVIGQIGEAHGKTVFLAAGSLRAQIARQPPGRPLVFTTPHAQATVVGTRLRLAVTDRGTRLDVDEGRVRLSGAGEPVEVAAGQYAVTARGAEVPLAPRARATLLFVVGAAPPAAADQVLVRRFEKLGFSVEARTPGALAEAARNADIVAISATIHSTDINTELRDLPVPVVVWEPWLYDDLGMTGSQEAHECEFVPGSGNVLVKDPLHPLAAGLTGTVRLRSEGEPALIGVGTPGPHAAWIATLPGRPLLAAVFAYERGAPMVGASAPARRVGLFLYDDTPLRMTDAGWAIFDAAILWAAQDRAR
jgi:hypothetical protein